MSHRTPTTRDGLAQYDHLPAAEAVAAAWGQPGRNPYWHHAAMQEVRSRMPLLARALDRLVSEQRGDESGAEPPSLEW